MSPEITLFNAALGLGSPWKVVRVTFDTSPESGSKELHLYVDYADGSKFSCPECQADCSVYDSEADRVWRHLNFFQHKAFLHAHYPRVNCKACGVRTVAGNWARPGSGFTLLFEAFVLVLCKAMPVRAVAALVDEHDTLLWRRVEHFVEQAMAEQDLSAIRAVKVDETARRSGQDYVTLFADGDTGKVVVVADGKDASTIDTFDKELCTHGGSSEQIESFSLDMSPAFESGVNRHYPKAQQVVDRFHVVKMANDAVDNLRRSEAREHPELKKTRYLWLKNPENLTERQKQTVEELCAAYPTLHTVLAYQSKLSLQRLWDLPDRESAAAYLTEWCQCSQTILSKVVTTIRKQSHRILNYFTVGRQTDRITNGMMEGINSIVQAVKAKARGYASDRYLRWMIFLTVGNLTMPLPTLNSE
jgi:transposase